MNCTLYISDEQICTIVSWLFGLKLLLEGSERRIVHGKGIDATCQKLIFPVVQISD